MRKTRLYLKKISLIVLAFFLTLAILEIGLRAGGFLLGAFQEYRNLRAIRQTGKLRIMCLGESTTQNQYPRHLEEILNARDIGIKFSVIDKGLTCSTTGIILSEINANLDKYNPDMVVTMMGTNDKVTLYYRDIPEANTLLFRWFRAYRFARILYAHILKRINRKDIYDPASGKKVIVSKKNAVAEKTRFHEFKKAHGINIKLDPTGSLARELSGVIYRDPKKLAELENSFKKALAVIPGNCSAYEGLGWLYGSQRRFNEAEQAFKMIITLAPGNNDAYDGLGWIYRDQGDFAGSEKAFKKAIDLNPGDSSAHTELIQLYREQGNYEAAKNSFRSFIAFNPKNKSIYKTLEFYKDIGEINEAKQALKNAIALDPQNDSAYEGLGWILRDQSNFPESEQAFLKAIELNPKNEFAYEGLGSIYGAVGRFSEVETAFRKIIEINPRNTTAYKLFDRFYLEKRRFVELEQISKEMLRLAPDNDSAYAGLGWLYNILQKYDASQKAFEKALEINPLNDFAVGGLATRYQELDESDISRTYSEKLAWNREEYVNPATTANYLQLKKILDRKKIKLVCVQYPMRSIAPLKKIFENELDKHVIFVDNDKLFRDAIKKERYSEYFKDMFGGDFGHCTEKGNRLLARSIADSIIKEFFNK
ncbi:MAG: tetratricopeptide repeat protein [Candidatus Omnitrophica bacterium]|nr:tetratricopeptide repeat protein [Candidatus Omnitrophota bacterium]